MIIVMSAIFYNILFDAAIQFTHGLFGWLSNQTNVNQVIKYA